MAPHNTSSKKDHDENKHGSDSESKKTSPKCPRCDSPNTKFCYYNNYSLSQPRHYCKTCRRYWTNGGALRNVPIGGGCRKKTTKSSLSSSSSSSASSLLRLSRETLFQGINSPSLEFQFGGLPYPMPTRPSGEVSMLHRLYHQPSLTTGFYNQLTSIGDTANSSFQPDPANSSNALLGLNNYPISSPIQRMNSMNLNSTLTSSIESLSSINQDLHLKLQQQRLATMFGGENQKENSNNNVSQPQVQLQPILFQNLEVSKPEMFEGGIGNSRKEGPSGDATMDWFFGNSCYSSMAPTTTTNGSVGIGHDNSWGNLEQSYSPVLP